MVPGATNQQPQASQLAPMPSSSSTVPPATTEEEEFLKRNTDCVYFLASPLTCKKGNECEYRHSDIARVNPRDCWYWLNGNCLNPKCGFRHPPLDGLLGAEVPTPVGPSVPQAPVMPAPNGTPYVMSKQGVACIFFQKGFCLKGPLCPFLHGPPNVVNNKAVQPVPPNPVNKPSRNASYGPEKSIQEQKFAQHESIQKPTELLPPQGKQVPRVQVHTPARNGGGVAMDKKVVPPPEEAPKYRPAIVVPPTALNEFPTSRSNHGYEAPQVSDNEGNLTGKEVDEYSREPTPGFDVLVDGEVGESDYYPNEEQFGRSRGHEFDIGHSTDYDVDRDMYSEQLDYDHFNREGYAWGDHRESSERMLGVAANFGRKQYPRDGSPDQFDTSDLRHRISKQRRGNVGGLRSVVSREHARDSHTDWMPRRVSPDHRMDHSSLSSRLRGRIKIPERSKSPGYGNDLRMEREIDMGRRRRSRYSPGGPPHASSNHRRPRDRIKGSGTEDFNIDGRDYRGSRGRRDVVASDLDSEFTGPKRLSELKSGRVGEGYEQQTDDLQSLGKRKYHRAESQQSEDNLSFEGPKPLSEILKRKRGVSVLSSVIEEDSKSKERNGNNQKEIKEIESRSMVHSNKVESESGEKQSTENNKSSVGGDVSEPENKAGSVDEDAMLDQELEAYDHRDGDYDYEHIDEEYNLEEGENPDEEYLEEDEVETGNKESEIKVYSS